MRPDVGAACVPSAHRPKYASDVVSRFLKVRRLALRPFLLSAGLSFWQRSASARRRLVLLSLAFALVSLLAFVLALLAFPFVLHPSVIFWFLDVHPVGSRGISCGEGAHFIRWADFRLTRDQSKSTDLDFPACDQPEVNRLRCHRFFRYRVGPGSLRP